MENPLYAPKISTISYLGNLYGKHAGNRVAPKPCAQRKFFLSAQPNHERNLTSISNRDVASVWEYFSLEKRQGGKITLKGAHGMYVSAQADGGVQINRKAAPQGGWEEFMVEDRGNNVVCLKSCHGKYLSAQQDGTAQWNRDYAPPGGWEDIQFVQQSDTGQGAVHAPESIEILEDAPGKLAQMTEESKPRTHVH